MFKHVTLMALVAALLCGCRTTQALREVDGLELAGALADYVALENRLPSDIEALRAFDRNRHSVRWRNLRECCFQPVSKNAVRVTYTDASGTSDYRIVVIYARNLPPLPVGANSIASTDILSDPKIVVAFYH